MFYVKEFIHYAILGTLIGYVIKTSTQVYPALVEILKNI